MQIKNFTDVDEASEFVKEFDNDDTVAYTCLPEQDGSITVKWITHKKYTDVNGTEIHDEIWQTRDGQLILVQDLETEHLRNILRMILRNRRERTAQLASLFESIAEGYAGEQEAPPEGENVVSGDMYIHPAPPGLQ